MKERFRSFAETKLFLTPGAYRATQEATHGIFDVVVVGGGIVGLATARQIALQFPKKTVCVVEKEPALAHHQSGHNSGVIHAGIYYKPGSDKAQCCVDGARMMYDYCEKNQVPYERVGKLIVALDKSEYPILEELLENGRKNGVQGLEILDSTGMRKLEPNIAGYAALHSPNTGICDFAEATRSFGRDLKATGRGEVLCNFKAENFKIVNKDGKEFIKVEGRELGQYGPTKAVLATNVVTCAGLDSDKVSIKAGGNKKQRITPFRGRYMQMKEGKKSIVKRNIYPVPNNSAGIAVGIHFTPTVDNNRGRQMIIGPGCCLAFAREGYRMTNFNWRDMATSLGSPGLWWFGIKNFRMGILEIYRDFSSRAFLAEAQKLVPSVTSADIEPCFSGVMAQLFMDNGTAAVDFIYESNEAGNMIHVRNAPSPACTASMAIAEHISSFSAKQFAWTK
eukprot:Selendium_serpulae@DN5746_c1_g1_i1.p1